MRVDYALGSDGKIGITGLFNGGGSSSHQTCVTLDKLVTVGWQSIYAPGAGTAGNPVASALRVSSLRVTGAGGVDPPPP